jgi:hypothetical protein
MQLVFELVPGVVSDADLLTLEPKRLLVSDQYDVHVEPVDPADKTPGGSLCTHAIKRGFIERIRGDWKPSIGLEKKAHENKIYR